MKYSTFLIYSDISGIKPHKISTFCNFFIKIKKYNINRTCWRFHSMLNIHFSSLEKWWNNPWNCVICSSFSIFFFQFFNMLSPIVWICILRCFIHLEIFISYSCSSIHAFYNAVLHKFGIFFIIKWSFQKIYRSIDFHSNRAHDQKISIATRGKSSNLSIAIRNNSKLASNSYHYFYC